MSTAHLPHFQHNTLKPRSISLNFWQLHLAKCQKFIDVNIKYENAARVPMSSSCIQSLLIPTFPIFRKPQALMATVARESAKQYQKAALYPSKSASLLVAPF